MKFSGGPIGFQFVTAEIAAVRAETDEDDGSAAPPPAADEPFLELADLLEATVLTKHFPLAMLSGEPKTGAPKRDPPREIPGKRV